MRAKTHLQLASQLRREFIAVQGSPEHVAEIKGYTKEIMATTAHESDKILAIVEAVIFYHAEPKQEVSTNPKKKDITLTVNANILRKMMTIILHLWGH